MRYNLVCGKLRLAVNEKRKLFQTSFCSKMKHIPYNLILATQFNDSSILITIISWDYLNLSLANEYLCNIKIPNQVIKYNQRCSMRISQIELN